MRLFIAEKPSLARAIAEGLSGAGKAQSRSGAIVCGEDVVTWCFGHLLEQCAPEDYDPALRSWTRETLPIVPAIWKLKARDKAADQLKIIGDLLRAATSVVNAGDPDREGQLLVDEVLEHFRYCGPVQRIWLASLDARSVSKALATLSDNTKHVPLRDAARARSQADWLVGLNATRAMTLLGRAAGREGVLSLGRVQTPTLALVVARDRDIAAFKPVDHFVLQARLEHGAGIFTATFQPGETQPGLDSEGRLVDQAEAVRVGLGARGATGRILRVTREKKLKPVPLPHCLSSLQKAASARLGLTAQQVLDAAQSLYEKKLTTYPRTDCRYLPEEQFSDAPRVLIGVGQALRELEAVATGADSALRGPVWDTKKVTAHHAIIPTGEIPASLSPPERGLYILIATAYALQFYKPMSYEAQKIAVELGEKATLWEARGRLVLEAGWTGAGAESEDEESENDAKENEGRERAGQPLPAVAQDDAVSCVSVEQLSRRTSPPAKFTEGTLIEAMANVHRFVQDAAAKATLKDNEGIGTEATRAGILETLKGRGYLRSDKKALVSTELGQEIIDLTPDTLKNPVTTAQWESRLAAIEAGKETIAAFMAEQMRVLPELLAPLLTASPALAKGAYPCPECGRALAKRTGKNGPFWGCTGYPECGVTRPDDNGKPGEPKPATPAFACPECSGALKHFKSKKGSMCFACFAEDAHKTKKPLFWDDKGGKPDFTEKHKRSHKK